MHHAPADARLMRTALNVVMPKLSAPKSSRRFRASNTPPPAYPSAQPRDETASRSSGGAISGRKELYTTIDAPKLMLEMISSAAPSM